MNISTLRHMTSRDRLESLTEKYGSTVSHHLNISASEALFFLLPPTYADMITDLAVGDLAEPRAEYLSILFKYAEKYLSGIGFDILGDHKVISVEESINREGMENSVQFSADSWNTPVIITLPFIKRPLLMFVTENMAPTGVEMVSPYIVVHPEDTKALFTLMELLWKVGREKDHSKRTIRVWGRDTEIPLPSTTWSTWENVFLADEVRTQIQDDLKFFMENKAFFRKHGLPYKRGYLLTGEPGNGKTMICRTIATSLPVTAMQFDFSNPEFQNDHLTQAFQSAIENSPSVVFMEDLDRIFEPEKPVTNITKDHLLNCLDGLGTNDGLIVVATANNPQWLDEAILKRPGRFDRVIKIGLPDETLRKRYLTHLFRTSKISERMLDDCVNSTKGMSMAFLKELFVASACYSFNAGHEDISDNDIKPVITQLIKQYALSSAGNRKPGFGH